LSEEMEEKKVFLIKLVLSESLMAIGIVSFFLFLILPRREFLPMPASYYQMANAVVFLYIISPIFFWAGGIFLHNISGDKMPVGPIIWYGLLGIFQTSWIFILLYSMIG